MYQQGMQVNFLPEFTFFGTSSLSMQTQLLTDTAQAADLTNAKRLQVRADYDGDGKADFGYVRSGVWSVRQSSQQFPSYF